MTACRTTSHNILHVNLESDRSSAGAMEGERGGGGEGSHLSDQRPVYPAVKSLNDCHDLFHKGGRKLSACAAAVKPKLQQNPLPHFLFLHSRRWRERGRRGGHSFICRELPGNTWIKFLFYFIFFKKREEIITLWLPRPESWVRLSWLPLLHVTVIWLDVGMFGFWGWGFWSGAKGSESQPERSWFRLWINTEPWTFKHWTAIMSSLYVA